MGRDTARPVPPSPEQGAVSFSSFGLLSTLLFLGVTACADERAKPAASPGASIVVVDDAGDTVRLAGPAHRIVSLIPATTELLFAIGAGERIVGRTHWCDYPDAAERVPDLGDGMNPNLEAVVAARPDLVVLYLSGQKAEAAAVVPGDLVRAVSLLGTEDEIATQLKEFAEAGVTTLLLNPLGATPEERVRDVATLARLNV